MLHSAQVEVDLGMPSTAVVNAHHTSSALSNRVPFRCFFTCEKRKIMWQGERSGEHGGCPRQQLHLRLMEKVHIWCWCVRRGIVRKGHRIPSLGGAGTKMADHRETAVHAPVPGDYMSVCPQRMVATWPDLPKEQTVIFLCAADFFSFWGGDLTENSQTADCILIS